MTTLKTPEIETLVVREILSGVGDRDVLKALVSVLKALEVPLLSPKAMEPVAEAAAVKGFHTALPGHPAEGVAETFDWPDVLQGDIPLPTSVVEKVFFSIGQDAGRKTAQWYAWNRKRTT